MTIHKLLEPQFPLRLWSNRTYQLHKFGCVVHFSIDGEEFGANFYDVDAKGWECEIKDWRVLFGADGILIQKDDDADRLRLALIFKEDARHG